MSCWIVLVAMCVLGCERSTPQASSSASTSSTPTDPSAPRIVALSPAVAIILRDMGYSPQIVGRHGYDLVLDTQIPVCGDQAGINFETLLKVTPTHVFTQWGTRELPTRLTDLARDHHWTLEDTRLLALDDIPESARRLDRSLAGPTGSENGQRLAARLDAAFAARTPEQRRGLFTGTVLMLVSTKAPSALGPGSFHHQLLERLGGTPAIATGNPYIELSAEDIVRLAPQAILLLMPRSPTNRMGESGDSDSSPSEAAKPMDRLGVLHSLTIPAVASGRVAVIDDPLCLTPSSAMMSVAGEMEQILREWGK